MEIYQHAPRRGRPHGSDDISAEAFHSTVFYKKVSDIRAATSSTAAACFTSTDCVFLYFRSVTHDAWAVRSLPNKQCASDPIRTWLFKNCSAELVPFLCHRHQRHAICRPNDATSLCLVLGSCIDQVADWMFTNRLQLNAAKTEFTWFVPPRRRHQLPSVHIVVGSAQVNPATT